MIIYCYWNKYVQFEFLDQAQCSAKPNSIINIG